VSDGDPDVWEILQSAREQVVADQAAWTVGMIRLRNVEVDPLSHAAAYVRMCSEGGISHQHAQELGYRDVSHFLTRDPDGYGGSIFPTRDA
jgi:hypothetical protein